MSFLLDSAELLPDAFYGAEQAAENLVPGFYAPLQRAAKLAQLVHGINDLGAT